MKKTLTLLRHAKSGWDEPDTHDFERSLNERGLKDAATMAQRQLERASTPDLILCSGATRTQQTAKFFIDALELPSSAISYYEELYLGSAGTLLEFIQQTSDDVNHLMIIAHNPGLEALGRQLHPNAPHRLPTSGLLEFSLNGDNFEIQPDTDIELVLHDFPKRNAR